MFRAFESFGLIGFLEWVYVCVCNLACARFMVAWCIVFAQHVCSLFMFLEFSLFIFVMLSHVVFVPTR